ncbi:hypothetical protein ACERIM_14750 [Natrinema sp. H-ect1]|uniref:hypothetical protein n=1 Tax=Natrinema sp. H-ect1 TaxID=3242700 RepID=UPI00359DB004
MGELARETQGRLRDALVARHPALEWQVEHRLAGTPVDIAGIGDDRLVLLELEWRRADPADNAAKLFRHLEAGLLDAFDAITVCHCFTEYYDLASGGVSSKRKNAEFVGRIASRAVDRFAYHPVELPLEPPKRGGDRPPDLPAAVDRAVDSIDRHLER